MAILGITNRTENWKTARHFAPLFGADSVRLARRLLATEEERARLQPGDVRLELFWVGMRDYFDRKQKKLAAEEESLATAYSEEFRDLRGQVESFQRSGRLRPLRDENYLSSPENKTKLARNLFHTEIDIVLESPKHLFIGEAKHESDFDGNSAYILTHQLIRQYVMASILAKISNRAITVVPFVVGDSRNELKKQHQVEFTLREGWMREENVLEWSDIEALW